MSQLRRDTVFIALTRPQMFAGVTYSYFVINALLATELFLIFRSGWTVLIALMIHAAGVLLCMNEPRAVDLMLIKSMRCPRVRNYRIWRCNSYRA